eukprot:5979571-Pleurochrysis_carterae.AAC.1
MPTAGSVPLLQRGSAPCVFACLLSQSKRERRSLGKAQRWSEVRCVAPSFARSEATPLQPLSPHLSPCLL